MTPPISNSSKHTDDPIEQKSSNSSNEEKSKDKLGSMATDPSDTRQSLEQVRRYKNYLYSLPVRVKLLKLAKYSSCQSESCKCNGWRVERLAAQQDVKLPPIDLSSITCKACAHPGSQHLSHLPTDSLLSNVLLAMVAELEYLCRQLQQPLSKEARRGHVHLARQLRDSVLTMTRPLSDTRTFGWPPFEEPSAKQILREFVARRLGYFTESQARIVAALEKLLVEELDDCLWPAPGALDQDYGGLYTRWIVYCHLPDVCESLPHFDATEIFGKTMLRRVFAGVRQRLMRRFADVRKRKSEGDNKLDDVVAQSPKFLQMLEKEIYADDSPIWIAETEMTVEDKDESTANDKDTSEWRSSSASKKPKNNAEVDEPSKVKEFVTKITNQTGHWPRTTGVFS